MANQRGGNAATLNRTATDQAIQGDTQAGSQMATGSSASAPPAPQLFDLGKGFQLGVKQDGLAIWFHDQQCQVPLTTWVAIFDSLAPQTGYRLVPIGDVQGGHATNVSNSS